MYDAKDVDYLHDTLIDLIISCMRSGYIPHEEPSVGDWCIEISHFASKPDNDNCIGKLVKVLDESDYEISTVGGKVVTWRNAILIKIPDKYMRQK